MREEPAATAQEVSGDGPHRRRAAVGRAEAIERRVAVGEEGSSCAGG